MSKRSFKIFVRYELDGEEKEFFFFKDFDMRDTDHQTVGPIIDAGQSLLLTRLAWDSERVTSIKVWWTERPVS